MMVEDGARRITAPETPFKKSSSVEVAAQRFWEDDIGLENEVV
jgi:hypothetical protein